MIDNINEYNSVIDINHKKIISFTPEFFKFTLLPKNINIDINEYQLVVLYCPPNDRRINLFNSDIHLADELGLIYYQHRPKLYVFDVKENKLTKILKYEQNNPSYSFRIFIPTTKTALNNPETFLIIRSNGDIVGINILGVDINYNTNGFTIYGETNGKLPLNEHYIMRYVSTTNSNRITTPEYLGNMNSEIISAKTLHYSNTSNANVEIYKTNRNLYTDKLTKNEYYSDNLDNFSYITRICPIINTYQITPCFYSMFFKNNIFGILSSNVEQTTIRQYKNNIIFKYYYDILGVSQRPDGLFYIIFKSFGHSKHELQLCDLDENSLEFIRLKFLKYINQHIQGTKFIYFDDNLNEYIIQSNNLTIYDNHGILSNLFEEGSLSSPNYTNYHSHNYNNYGNVKEKYETDYMVIYPILGLILSKDQIGKKLYTTNHKSEYNLTKIIDYNFHPQQQYKKLDSIIWDTIYTNTLSDFYFNKNTYSMNEYVVDCGKEIFYVYKNTNMMGRLKYVKTLINYTYLFDNIKNTKDVIIKNNNTLNYIKLNIDLNYILNLIINDKILTFNNIEKFYIEYKNKIYNNLTELKNNLLNDFKNDINDTLYNKQAQLNSNNGNDEQYLSDMLFVQNDFNNEYKPQLYYNNNIISCGIKDKITYSEHIITHYFPNIIYDKTDSTRTFNNEFTSYNIKYITNNKLNIYLKLNNNNKVIQLVPNIINIQDVTSYDVFDSEIYTNNDIEYNLIDSTNVTINKSNNKINLNIQNDNNICNFDTTINNIYGYIDLIIENSDFTNIINNIYNETEIKDILALKITNKHILYLNLQNKTLTLYKQHKTDNTISQINIYNELDDRCIGQYSNYKNKTYFNKYMEKLHTDYIYNITPTAEHYHSINMCKQPSNRIITSKITNLAKFKIYSRGTNYSTINVRLCIFSGYQNSNGKTTIRFDMPLRYNRINLNFFTGHSSNLFYTLQYSFDIIYKMTTKFKLNGKYIKLYINGSEVPTSTVSTNESYFQNKFMYCPIYKNTYINIQYNAMFNCELPQQYHNEILNNSNHYSNLIEENTYKIINNKLEKLQDYKNISIKKIILTFYNVDNKLYILINGQPLCIIDNMKTNNIINILKYGNKKTVENIKISTRKTNLLNYSNMVK